ncbi:MAG: hypothetical protein JJ858_18940, partial [Rhizobiaceae bacterium]|nr:hypothetical protein [Rhizobiaceae bacterium]
MELTLFFEALKSVGTSLYALIAYFVVAIIWGVNLWRNYRLRTISEKLKDLPENDRLKALELEYKLVPKEGLDAESYLKYSAKNNLAIIVIITIFAITAIAALALYKSLRSGSVFLNSFDLFYKCVLTLIKLPP